MIFSLFTDALSLLNEFSERLDLDEILRACFSDSDGWESFFPAFLADDTLEFPLISSFI